MSTSKVLDIQQPILSHDFKPILKPFIPYHERLNNYLKVRERIFSDFSNTPRRHKSKRATKRLRRFWKNIIATKKKLISSIILGNDRRMYTDITLFDKNFMALLDSGANISCVGNEAAKYILENHSVIKCKGNIKTADGTYNSVVAKFWSDLTYNSLTKRLEFFVIPSLKQDVFLGSNFWNDFGLFNKLISSTINPIVSELDTGKEDINKDPPKTHNLSEIQRTKLNSIIDIFPSYDRDGLGKTSMIQHSIDVGDTKPVKQRHWPVSPAIEKLMFQEIDHMLSLGVIEESTSPWTSNCVLVRRGDKNRLCLDSREINKHTINDAYPLPHIDGIMSRLPPAKFITGLDMKHAFWQIPLDEKSRQITAFTVPNRPLYQYTVMPFGLCNAPQTLCRLMDRVIPAHLRTRVFVYLDDLLVLSDDFDSHLVLLQEVALCLRKANLTINIAKSKFCLTEIKYLGFIVGQGQLRTDSEKIKAIVDFPVPSSVKQLRSFLGLSGWYRRFIDNFSSISFPLTNLLRKNQIFSWNDEAQHAFEKLKSLMTSAPILMTPNFSKKFILQCDASLHGLGCVLTQENDDGIELPIAFMSAKLTKAQRNYSVTELECLAVVQGIKKFRAYIEGTEFSVITDHASLQWLMRQRDLSGRLARWALKLQGYTFTIQHRKGTENVVADTLSRISEGEVNAMDENGPIVDLSSEHFNSEDYSKLKNNVCQNQSRFPDLKIIDKFLYKRTQFSKASDDQDACWKLWVPKDIIPDVLYRAHNPPSSAHCGMSKMIEKLKRHLFWPKMVSNIREYVSNCETCRCTKSPNIVLRPPMGRPMMSERPFQKLFLDILGPYPRSKNGNIGLLIIVDHLSKFMFLHPLKKFTSKNICDYLRNYIFSIFGVPESVLTDNGSQFKAGLFESFLTKFGVKHICTAIYSPQANSSERVNRSVIASIRAYIGKDHTNWDCYLPEICSSLRSTVHRSTGFSPYHLVFGQEMILHGKDYKLLQNLGLISDDTRLEYPDAIKLIREKAKQNIEDSHEENAFRYNLRSRPIQYLEGELVLARNFVQSNASRKISAKLSPTFNRAKVKRKLGSSYYELMDDKNKILGVYHAKDMQKFSK